MKFFLAAICLPMANNALAIAIQQTFAVNSSSDVVDFSIDGTCDISSDNAGACAFRAATEKANPFAALTHIHSNMNTSGCQFGLDLRMTRETNQKHISIKTYIDGATDAI